MMDPIADKYHPISPYAFAVNNPVLFVDPNGMEIILNGSVESVAQFLMHLSNSTSYAYSWNKESGKVSIEKTKGDSEKSDVTSDELDNLVYGLIDGDQKDKSVVYNLISNGEDSQGLNSEKVFVDDFETGVFDVQDLNDLDPSNPHTNPLIAGLLGHTLKERSMPKDYKAIVDSYKYGQYSPEYDNAHLMAGIFESDVMESYYERLDGSKVEFERAHNTEPRDRGKYTSYSLEYGPLLSHQVVHPSNNRNTKNVTPKISPTIVRKRK